MTALTQFLGWCLVFNSALLAAAVLAMTLARTPIMRIHQSMFAMSEQELMQQYFAYLGHYKLLVTVFNLVPFVALKVMA